jgi:hypothetical protein
MFLFTHTRNLCAGRSFDEEESLALLNGCMNAQTAPLPNLLPNEDGTKVLALFSLGSRIGDEGIACCNAESLVPIDK